MLNIWLTSILISHIDAPIDLCTLHIWETAVAIKCSGTWKTPIGRNHVTIDRRIDFLSEWFQSEWQKKLYVQICLMILDQKAKRKTDLHVVWPTLANTYGSILHQLINYTISSSNHTSRTWMHPSSITSRCALSCKTLPQHDRSYI